MEDVAAGGGDIAWTTPPPAPTCPVCMEPWNCIGDHRICCIPCGHVYGRSCLERWLHRSGDSGAKCPQCGEQFEHKLITNLYAPGNLWNGCCRIQEVKALYESKFREESARSSENFRALVLKVERMEDDINAEKEFIRADTRRKLYQIERMKKMAEEEKVTVADLIEFMELYFRSEKPHASVSAPALVDSQNNTKPSQNQPDQLPPVPAPSSPADAVKKRRRPNPPNQLPPVPAPSGPADAVKEQRRRGT